MNQLSAVIVVMLFVGCSYSSAEETVKGGYVACDTQEYLLEMSQAASNKDAGAMSELMKNGCYVTESDVEIEVLEITSSGMAKIRSLFGDDSQELWTNIENINSDKIQPGELEKQ